MTNKFRIYGALAVAGTLFLAGTARADRPAWCKDGVLLDSQTFDDGGQARDYANAHTGSATINGGKHEVIGTVHVATAPVGNRVYVAQVWDCPPPPPPPPPQPPANGGGNGAQNGGNNGGKEKVTYTLDPHPELDRNGKRR